MSKAKTYDLLPCPFCGHHPVEERWMEHPRRWVITCMNWNCPVGPQVLNRRPGRAARAWNTRDGKAP